MKKTVTFVIACVLVSQAFAQTAAQSAEALCKQGSAAEKAGDLTEARNLYASALKLDPNNADARYNLGQLRINSAAIAAKGREAKFGAVVIPVFQMDKASLQEALDSMNLIISKQSKDDVAPNFVIQDPKNLLADRKITLNLKNMPAKAVLKYCLDQTGSKARYDEHAVVIIAQ